MQCFGTFCDKEAAARAYDLGSIAMYGEEAVLNFSLFDYWDFQTGELKTDLPWKTPAAALKVGRKPQKRRKKTIKGERGIKTEIKEEQEDSG